MPIALLSSLSPLSITAFLAPAPLRSLAPLYAKESHTESTATTTAPSKRRIELTWCNHGECTEALREKVLDHNHIELGGPATGQVVYRWENSQTQQERTPGESAQQEEAQPAASVTTSTPPAVLFLVKQDDPELANVAIRTIEQLLTRGIQVLVEGALATELEEREDWGSGMIRLFEPKVCDVIYISNSIFNISSHVTSLSQTSYNSQSQALEQEDN